MKRAILSSLLIITLLSFLIGGATMAYFTSEDELKPAEKFQMGTVKIDVDKKWCCSDFTIQCDHGKKFTQKWEIENTGSLPVWVRVTLTDKNGSQLPGDIQVDLTDTTNWTQGSGDDYWYCKNPVEPGEDIDIGFNVWKEDDIDLAGGSLQPDCGGGDRKISLKMQAEAIQAEHVDRMDWPKEAVFDD